MSTYALTFVTDDGGIQHEQPVGGLGLARGLLRLWAAGSYRSDCDRVCLLQVPSASERKRTTFRGQAFVFNREEALRWASK